MTARPPLVHYIGRPGGTPFRVLPSRPWPPNEVSDRIIVNGRPACPARLFFDKLVRTIPTR